MNIKSNNIKIYPTASRTMEMDYGANINLEQNIVGLSNDIVDYDNYVVNCNITTSNNQLEIVKLECIYKGYSIKINNFVVFSGDLTNIEGQSLYLSANIEAIDQQHPDILYINGYDDNESDPNVSVYTGVELNLSSSSVSNSLCIGTITNLGFIINTNALSKFKGNTIQLDIDKTQGLTEHNYSGSFEDWINNDLIIDDGEI